MSFDEEEYDEKAAAESMADAMRSYVPRAQRFVPDGDHCGQCGNGEYVDSSTRCRCGCHFVEPLEHDR